MTTGGYVKWCVRVGFLGKNMGAQPFKMSPCSPLGGVVNYWGKYGGDPLTGEWLIEHCTKWWPLAKLGDGKNGPRRGH